MYFSTSAQGFYVGDELDKHVMPDDCLTVTVEQEKNKNWNHGGKHCDTQ